MDSAQLNVMHRKYGDHLYKKQDYDTAMQQYLTAIDNTEPSQVIRKVCHAVNRERGVLTVPSFWIAIAYTT